MALDTNDTWLEIEYGVRNNNTVSELQVDINTIKLL